MKKGLIAKLLILALIIAAGVAFWYFDLGQYFRLDYVKAKRVEFNRFYQQNPALVIGIYFAAYVLITGFSLPGAAIMTLVGGAMFGLVTGTVVVSFASSLGATLACFFARFVLQGWVQGKFGDRIEPINRGIARDGAFYLFTLRLVPAFPFFVINLVMGLTKMRLWTYYWVSQLGMLPGTIVYVNAGTQLGQIESLGDILSPGLIISFVILGVFPLVVKKTMAWVQARRGSRLPGPDAPPAEKV